MKKLNRLFAILIAVLGVGSLSAQTWTQSGEYYLYNESSKTFLSRGDSWGTKAVTDKYGIPFAWDPQAGSLKFLDSEKHLFTTDDGYIFTDNNSTGWAFEGIDNTTCYLKDTKNNRYVRREADGVLELTTTVSEATIWTFKTPTQRNEIVATYATENYTAIIQSAGLNIDASSFVETLYGNDFARQDKTSSIGTATFSGNAGSWTWTEFRGQKGQPAYGTNFVEVWQATGTFSQKITNLPSGIYKLTVNGFHRQGGYNKCNDLNNKGFQLSTATLEGNGQEVQLKPWVTERTGDMNPNNTGEAVSAFNSGKYNNEVYVYVAPNGILDISVNAKNFVDNCWVLFNNFTLTYFSNQVNEKEATDIIETANTLSGTMPDVAVQDLEIAKNAFESNRTIANYNRLSVAIETAKNYIEWYAPLQKEIEKAEAIGVEANEYKINIKNGFYANKEEVTDAVEKLMVSEYSYVKDVFPYDVELLKADGWNSKGNGTAAGTFSNEHWSGTTREYKNQQDGDNWGWGASAWSIDFDQSVTLPAGEYVFKVAGRKSTEATLELTVTKGNDVLGSVNDFPSSNNAKGINKAGATSFDANDPEGFANNGSGFGWQWRYVKFALEAESTVKVAVHAETNAIHQWVSFGDYTLHMDESAYLETNKDGLIAPMAAAQALVGVKPMGKDEATAIQTAINMTVSTGAELKAKIDALNTAVANANQWVVDYNNAKAPLVTALERFEADFNNDEGNEPGYMKKGLWSAVIKEVQEAALAKDITDSYDGFSTAAHELNAALDAVRASIDMYANLKAEISYANNYAPMIAENIAGHTDAIATAQALYDSAEADDASAEILAMQNYRILDHNHATDYIAEHNFEIKELTWSGQTNTNNNEHWSGVTNAYFDYSKWSEGYIDGANEAIVTVTLSAGEYVLQAAGRVATVAGSEAYIKVNDTKVNFTAKGAYGYGIATDGTATFAKDATYARENEGFGWEYRSIMFSLTEDTEVTLVAGMTIDANTADLSWASVCTPVLYAHEYEYVEVDLTFSTTGWATLILPFDAELPEDMTAYSCYDTDGEVLELVENESIKANTPYLMKGQEGDNYLFSGYSLADKDSHTDGLFTGTYVEYQTQADGKTYVFQSNNGETAFYLVSEDEPIVQPYNCYIVCENAEGTPIFRLTRNGGTTNIDDSQLTNNHFELEIYDLMGRKVSSMEKGKMYIVNGVKVIVK